MVMLGLSFSCKKKTGVDPKPTDTRSTLLTKNKWVIERFTDADNKTIQESRLRSESKLLYDLLYEFRSNNQVRAIVKVNAQVINGGTWAFTNNDQNLNIDIPGLKDDFKVIELTKSKLVIRPNEKVFPIVDNQTVVNMEFIPSL